MRFPLLAFLILISGSSSPLMAQAPGAAWAIAPGPERTVKTLYWQAFDQRETWTRLVPKAADGTRPFPFDLVFSATFKGEPPPTGRPVATAPLQITILAQPSPIAALPIPSLSFVLVTDDGRRFDLISNGMATKLPSLGENCCNAAILARIDEGTLRALVRGKKITANILGFECVLDADDMRALSDFARSVLPLETQATRR
jgi:hypothetical protein